MRSRKTLRPWSSRKHRRSSRRRGQVRRRRLRLTARPNEHDAPAPLPPLNPGAPLRQRRPHVSGSHRTGHRRCHACRPTRVRLRSGRRRSLWQRLPDAQTSPARSRRPHRRFAAGGRCGAWRLRRRGTRRAAANRRDTVQRLRRHRFQSAGQQRRKDSFSLGRIGANGHPDAVGWKTSCGALSLAEHRGLVLPHAGSQDRGALDAGGCAGAAQSRDRPSNSFLLEITARTWFGGDEILDTEEGILEVLDKLAEVKPNIPGSGIATRASFSRRCRPARFRWANTITTSPGSRRPTGSPCARPSPKRAGCSTRAHGACPELRRPWTKRTSSSTTCAVQRSRPSCRARSARRLP